MTAPNVFQTVLAMRTTSDANIDTATQAAIAAQQALQELQNTEAGGNTSVLSWNTVFSGADGSSLNGADFSASTGLKIRGNNGYVGIDETAANGLYRGDITYPYLTSNQSISIVVGSMDDASTAVSYTLFQCDSTRAAGAYVYIFRDTLKIGKFTRSGSTYTFNTPLATITTTLKPGSIVRAYNTGNTYYVKVNTIQKIAITDAGNTITRDASHVYSSILMERNSFFWTGDGPRFSSLAVSDDIAGGMPVSDSWLVTRSSTTDSTLSVTNGASANLPANFFATSNYAVGATVETLGTGRITIAKTDWYELSASIIAKIGSGSGVSYVGANWAVSVNSAQVTGPIASGGTVKMYLTAGDIVQPMIVATSDPNISAIASAGSSGSTTLATAPNVAYVTGFASWIGKVA